MMRVVSRGGGPWLWGFVVVSMRAGCGRGGGGRFLPRPFLSAGAVAGSWGGWLAGGCELLCEVGKYLGLDGQREDLCVVGRGVVEFGVFEQGEDLGGESVSLRAELGELGFGELVADIGGAGGRDGLARCGDGGGAELANTGVELFEGVGQFGQRCCVVAQRRGQCGGVG